MVKNLDYSRDWVQFIKPKLEEHFNDCRNDLNYQNCEVRVYGINNTLKIINTVGILTAKITQAFITLSFKRLSPKTELIDQYDINKKIVINVKEGDIVIFPSFIIHGNFQVTKDIKRQ